MKRDIDEVLDFLLTEIEKGKRIEDCLKEFPEYALELEPLLRLATELNDLPKPETRPEAIGEALRKVRAFVAERRQAKKRFPLVRFFSLQPAIVRVAAVVLLIVLIGWSSLALSTRSMPGDFFYPIKLVSEKVQYIFTINREGKAELRLIFADKRTEELVKMFNRNGKFNKELLNAMLNEAQSALSQSELMTGNDSKMLLEKVANLNQYQKKVLEGIRQRFCGYDTSILDEAIVLCFERHCCIQNKLNPQSGIEPDVYYRAWTRRCNWR
ncbi:MAG: DUF5667 domain-containing protein [candidate division WOR-3 bacterium]|nr:DUF5667 domain-containing protein [candidate division WOR-3 bacterium]